MWQKVGCGSVSSDWTLACHHLHNLWSQFKFVKASKNKSPAPHIFAYPYRCTCDVYSTANPKSLSKKISNGRKRGKFTPSWAGHFHVFSETLYLKHETDLRVARPKWAFKDLPDLKEQIAEAQLLDAGKDVKFVGKATLRVLQGQLSIRNQCAHPTLYRPSMNSAIGYVDEMIRQTLDYILP